MVRSVLAATPRELTAARSEAHASTIALVAPRRELAAVPWKKALRLLKRQRLFGHTRLRREALSVLRLVASS